MGGARFAPAPDFPMFLNFSIFLALSCYIVFFFLKYVHILKWLLIFTETGPHIGRMDDLRRVGLHLCATPCLYGVTAALAII